MANKDILFENCTIFNDDTIRLLFRAEYSAYERGRMYTRMVAGAVLCVFGIVAQAPVILKAVLLVIGAFLLFAKDFISDVIAQGLIEERGGAESRVKITFKDEGFMLDNGSEFRYFSVDRLIEDDEYFYLFMSKQNAVMVPRIGFTKGNGEDFRDFILRKTGKEFKKRGASLLSLNLRDILSMKRDRAERFNKK